MLLLYLVHSERILIFKFLFYLLLQAQLQLSLHSFFLYVKLCPQFLLLLKKRVCSIGFCYFGRWNELPVVYFSPVGAINYVQFFTQRFLKISLATPFSRLLAPDFPELFDESKEI